MKEVKKDLQSFLKARAELRKLVPRPYRRFCENYRSLKMKI